MIKDLLIELSPPKNYPTSLTHPPIPQHNSNLWLPESIPRSLILWDGAMLNMEKVTKGHTKIRILSSGIEINDALVHSSI